MDQTHKDVHKIALDRLCRLCGEKNVIYNKKYKAQPCTSIQDALQAVIPSIKLDTDNPKCHPSKICQKCYNAGKKYKYKGVFDETLKSKIEQTNKRWFYNDDSMQDNCWVCIKYADNKCLNPKKQNISESILNESEISFNASDITDRLRSTPKKHVTPQKPCVKTVELGMTPGRGRDQSIRELFKKPMTEKLSLLEEQLLTFLVKRKLNTHNDSEELIVNNKRGKRLRFMLVPEPRVESEKASSPLKRKRARKLQKIREKLSGRGDESSITQLSKEWLVQRRKKKIRERLELMCKIKPSIMNTRKIMAMKSKSRLSWGQLKEITRFMRDFNIKLESQNKQREYKTKLLSKLKLKAELKLFKVRDPTAPSSKKGMVYKKLPMAYISNLTKYLSDHISSMAEYKTLCLNHPVIPKDEIWVKLGADHGGKSFKTTLQVMNTGNPNKTNNCLVFAMFAAKDNRENMEKVHHKFKSDIEHIKNMSWQGRKIKLFMCGDYDFLTKGMGLSGPCGAYSCLFCHIHHSQYNIPRKDRVSLKITERSLATLKKHHKKFINETDGNIAKAKDYMNVINEPLFNIEINQICPPYLHILLGIVLKHHNLLLNGCNMIDRALGRNIARDNRLPDSKRDTPFGQYVTTWEKIYGLRNKLKQMKPGKGKNAVKDKITEEKATLKLKNTSGPVGAEMDNVLKRHQIKRAAYFGGSFEGNHANRYMKQKVFEDLGEAIVTKTKELAHTLSYEHKIVNEANELKNKIIQINEAYAMVHVYIGHSERIESAQIPSIQMSIDNYMNIYRKIYPDINILPKQHILEDHVIPWIKRYNCGMGLGGEQGVESVHKVFNELDRRMCGIKNSVNRLASTLSEHLLSCQPELITAAPFIKKRFPPHLKKLSA